MAPADAVAKGELREVKTSENIQMLIVEIPGVGTPQPQEWIDFSTRGGLNRLWIDIITEKSAIESCVLSYDHGITSTDLSWQTLLQHGLDFIERLLEYIDKSNVLANCPVLLISHSIGGLIAKEGLRIAYERHSRLFVRALAGVILLGTPHSKMEDENKWYNAVLTIPKAGKRKIDKKDISRLARSSTEFELAAVRVPILSVHETRKTKVKTSLVTTKRTLLMDAAFVKTGSINEKLLAADCDHNELCYLDTTAEYFSTISKFIDSAIEDARLKIVKGSPTFEVSDSLDDLSTSDFTPLSQTKSWKRADTISNAPSQLEQQRPEHASAIGSSDAGFDVDHPLGLSGSGNPVKSVFPCFSMPIPRNRDFFGRLDVLTAIDEVFFNDERDEGSEAEARIFAICGPGGMGKTQVATEFVYSRRDRFDVLVWIHADTASKLKDEFGRIATALGLLTDPADAQDQVVTHSLVRGWLANPVKVTQSTEDVTPELASWLLVLDNLDDPEILEGLVPLDGPGCILLTSRDSLAKNSTYLADTGIDLRPFNEEEASIFLEKLTKKQGDSRGVHERLGGIPLAITQMASVIIRRDMSYSEFVECYDEEGSNERLLNLRFETRRHRSVYKETIWSVWALEFLKHGRSLLEVLSILDPDGIPESVLTSKALKLDLLPGFPKTRSEYTTSRTELLQSSLITRDSAGLRIVVHRLIQDTARSKMSPVQFASAFSSAVQLISASWPYEKFGWRHKVGRWRVCEELFPHVLKLRHFETVYQEARSDCEAEFLLARLLTDAGWYYHETGYSIESRPFFEKAREICNEIKARQPVNSTISQSAEHIPEVDDIIAETHHNLGCIGTETNQPAFTLEHFRIFNEMMIQESGDKLRGKDERLSISWNELGNAYMMCRQWDKGEECFKNSIESTRYLPGSQHLTASFPSVNLGLAYWFMGKNDLAYETLASGLENREATYGIDDRESFITGRFLHALGNVTASQGEPEASFIYHQRALQQYEGTIGKRHHRTGDLHVKVGDHFLDRGNLDSAEFHFGEALKIFGEREVLKHELMRTLYKQSLLFEARGMVVEARRARQESITLYFRLFPESDKSRDQLSGCDFDDAVAFWSR